MSSGPAGWPAKARTFWPAFVSIYALDFVSKRLAESQLLPELVPHRVIGDFVRLTLAYNKDAAMGLSLGGYSRVGFAVTALFVLVVLGVLYRRTPAGMASGGLALGMIVAGALGNLTDRLISARGVVDFIDIGMGSVRFWTFNVADAAITCGAVLLALMSLKSNPEAKPAEISAPV